MMSTMLPLLFSWRSWRLGSSILLFAFAPPWAADEALKALQYNQLLRDQQQDRLQLRMQQYQTGVRADPRQRPALEQLEINQALRQQQLQLHQQRELQARPEAPSDDEGVRRAKAQIEEQRARHESRLQLQQF